MGSTLDAVREAVVPILKRHGVIRAGVFGSCARGDMTPDSDIDVLVEIGPDVSLLGFVRLKLQIEHALGRPIDLVEYDAIKPLLRDQIVGEQVRIL